MKNKIGIGLVVICVMVLGGWIALANPFKVTDPSDPRFDPMKFRFEDYKNEEELAKVFRILFPVGTPKEYVDKILIGSAGAKSERNDTYKNLVSYHVPWHYHWKNPPHYNFTFDERDRLLNIWLLYSYKDLYPDQPNYKQLYEKNLMQPSEKEK